MARSNALADEEILEQYYPVHNFKGGRRFCSDARRFLESTGQWPWEWCDDDLNPQQWRPSLVQDLARLAETCKRSGKNVDEAKLPLIRAMKRRKTTDKKNQFLDHRDVNKVINEFKPQQSSPSNSTTGGEHRRLNHVNKTRDEPTAVAKPTISKSTSQSGSSRGSRVTTELPDRSMSRARMATSTNSVEPNRAEPRIFMGSPMPMPERALSVMRFMSEMPSLPETTPSPDLSTPRARMATSTNSVETELGPFVSSPMSEDEPEPEAPLSTMPESDPVPETTDMPVAIHIPTTTRLPETTRVPESESVLETTCLPETTDLPDIMDMPEMIGMFDTMDMPESMNMSDPMDMPDTMYLPEITGLPETMYLPEITSLPQTTDMSEISGLPETTEVSETTHVVDIIPELMNMPQTRAMSATTHMADSMSEPMDMPEPESVPGTMVMPEAGPAAEEAPVVEDTFPMELETRDSKHGMFWDNVFESQSFVTRNKKRPSSSSILPPTKRARSTLLEAMCHAPDGIYDTIHEMRNHEMTLQKRVVLRDQERAAFQDSPTSYIEEQKLSCLKIKIRHLRLSIQDLERQREPLEEQAKEWEKFRITHRLPDTKRLRGSEKVNEMLRENTTFISDAEKTLQQTIEALNQQKAAGEKLAASMDGNYNEAVKELLNWHTLMKLVHGFPSSMDKVNAVLKKQDTSLEEIVFIDKKQEEEEEDDSGIDEPLIKTPEIPDLPRWDPLDGNTSLAKAPLHNDV